MTSRTPLVINAAEVAELDQLWTAVQRGEPTVTNDEVVRWLETWGTPAFKPWSQSPREA